MKRRTILLSTIAVATLGAIVAGTTLALWSTSIPKRDLVRQAFVNADIRLDDESVRLADGENATVTAEGRAGRTDPTSGRRTIAFDTYVQGSMRLFTTLTMTGTTKDVFASVPARVTLTQNLDRCVPTSEELTSTLGDIQASYTHTSRGSNGSSFGFQQYFCLEIELPTNEASGTTTATGTSPLGTTVTGADDWHDSRPVDLPDAEITMNFSLQAERRI